MCKLAFILITGRTTRQGTGISQGKSRPGYQNATSVVELNKTDMSRLGARDGDRVIVSTEFGSADVVCRGAEIPEGLAFIAFGPACNRLIGGETYASGMPDSKNITVEITRVLSEEL